MGTTMNEQMLTEELSIIRDCRNGRPDQYAVLVDRYRSLAYNLAYRMVGDPDAAQDMAQESFIAAYQGLKEFKFGSLFSTWLYTIIMNKCRDYLRAKRPNMSVDDLAEVRRDVNPSPEERAASRQAGDILQESLDALPTEYREVLVLKHVQELAYGEIADMLGISIGALKVRAHRGREMLRRKLEEAGVTHG
jgi:RNA polymerase sigma-70 factor, ECF subfamily